MGKHIFTEEGQEDGFIGRSIDTTIRNYIENPSQQEGVGDKISKTRIERGVAKGTNNSMYGKHHKEETKQRIRKIAIETGRVPYDPKVGSYMKGRKGKDTPNWKGGITPERQVAYSSKEWVDAVKGVWARDKAICQRCGKNHNETKNRGTFHIHHVVSFEVKELRTSVDNLVLLCAKCHRWVHGKKNVKNEFIREI